MADSKKTFETVVGLVPVYGKYFAVFFKIADFAHNWGKEDPVEKALNQLREAIQKITNDLEELNVRVNDIALRVVQIENKARVDRLREFARDIELLQLKIGNPPADANLRLHIAHEAGAIAETLLDELDLWNWTDIKITKNYDDDGVEISPEVIEPMPPDFKAFPALPVYVSAVMTWLTAIDLDTGGNYQLVQQRYGDKLRRHIAQVSTRPDWNEWEQPTTFPEHIQARITCFSYTSNKFALNGECHFHIECRNEMERRTTLVENSEYIRHVPTGSLCSADPEMGKMDERQIEADKGVEALTQLGELLRRVERTGTLRQQFIGRFDHTPSHNVAFIYAVRSDGELLWWRQQPSPLPNTLTGWLGPHEANSGWDGFVAVYPAGGNRFYALKPDGSLLWYQHDGFNDGARQWKPAIQVGNGWNSFATIFGGSDGVMYAVQEEGTLLWYKHNGYRDGGDVTTWAPRKEIASGWHQFKTIFSCGKGIIYAIGNDGTLFWYRHTGFENGDDTWDGPLKVGTGWQNFSHVFSVGDGIIYAIQADGTMLWYKHDAWNVDASILYGEGPFYVGPDSQDYARDVSQYMQMMWKGSLPAGSGWTGFRYVFPLLPSTHDGIR